MKNSYLHCVGKMQISFNGKLGGNIWRLFKWNPNLRNCSTQMKGGHSTLSPHRVMEESCWHSSW